MIRRFRKRSAQPLSGTAIPGRFSLGLSTRAVRIAGLVLVLLSLFLSLFLLSYSLGLSRESEKREKRIALLDRGRHDLDAIHLTILRRIASEKSGSPGTSPFFASLRTLAEDLGTLSTPGNLDGDTGRTLRNLSDALLRDRKRTGEALVAPRGDVTPAWSLDARTLHDTDRLSRTLRAAGQRERVRLDATLHRRRHLLAVTLFSLVLGTVVALTALVLVPVLRKSRREIKHREDLLNGLLASTTNGIILKDREGRWIDLSPRVPELLGFFRSSTEREERPTGTFPGKTDQEILALHPHLAPFLSENALVDPMILARKESLQSTVSLFPEGERPVHLLIDRAPLLSREGEIRGTVITLIDMTERVLLEDLQKISSRIASAGLRIQDASTFLAQVSQILLDQASFSLIWTTHVAVDRETGKKGLSLENFRSRSPRFVAPPTLPCPVGEEESGLRLDNGRAIDSWVVEKEHLHTERALLLSGSPSAFPFCRPELSGPEPFSSAVFPLFQGGRIFGTLGVLSGEHRSIPPEMEKILSRLAGTISLVLENIDSGRGRQLAENQSLLLRNFYEALSRIESLLLSLPEPGVLLPESCRILCETGNASACWIRVEEAGGGEVSFPCSAGALTAEERVLLGRMANEATVRASPGFSKRAHLSGAPTVSNDLSLLESEWTPSRFLMERGLLSLCSIPVSGEDPRPHSLVVAGDRTDYFTPDLIELLTHLAGSIGFGMDNFGRESRRKRETRRTERLKNMYQALSDANEILLARPRPEAMFGPLCRIIVSHGHALTAGFYLLDRRSGKGTLQAWEGPRIRDMDSLEPSADLSSPAGQGVFGETVRNGRSHVINLDDPDSGPTRAIRILARELGIRSIGGFPVRRSVGIEGVLVVTSTEPFFINAELARLIDRMVLNIAFALDNFDREEAKTEREKAIFHQSLHDSLTGLPNRIHFSEQIDGAIRQASRNGAPFAVGIVDLDNFREINERLGHGPGDDLLREVSKRLRETLRPSDLLSRQGGDEFGILFRDLSRKASTPDGGTVLDDLLQPLLASLARPFPVGEETIEGVSMSLGGALFPGQGDSTEILLKRADLALYESKSRGGGVWTLFSDDLETRLERTFMIRSDFDRSLDRDEILVHVQPQVSLETGEPDGAEALVRWIHPRKGLLLPEAFIQEVENSPALIRKLGLAMLEKTLTHMESWERAGVTLPVGVNIGARHFLDPHFTREVSRILADHPGIPSSRLRIEITESAALSDFRTVRTTLKHLRSIGVEVSLDDFGTGHASLSYLQEVPADTIKMDIQFVRDILVDPKDLAIVAGALTTARLMKLNTVAEGVESPEHGVVLMKLGCNSGQGFGIAPPMAASAFPGWIRNFRPVPLWTEWFDRNWSRRNILLLTLFMEHHRRSEDLYARIDAQTSGPARSGKSRSDNPSPLDHWTMTKREAPAGPLPQYREISDLLSQAHILASKMESLLENRQNDEARSLISEHRTFNREILRVLGGITLEETD